MGRSLSPRELKKHFKANPGPKFPPAAPSAHPFPSDNEGLWLGSLAARPGAAEMLVGTIPS